MNRISKYSTESQNTYLNYNKLKGLYGNLNKNYPYQLKYFLTM